MPLTPILKKTSLLMSPTFHKRVLFNTNENVRSLILKYIETNDLSHINNVLKVLSTSGSQSELIYWLSQMTECVSLLDRRTDKLIMEFLKIPWYKSGELAAAADNFIITLVTAHNYYAYPVLKQLFTFLVPDVDEDDGNLVKDAGLLTEEEDSFCQRALLSIVSIHNHVPMSQDNLLVIARKCMPYFKRHVHQQAVYTYNLLHLASLLPHLRRPLLEIIITNMVTIDVHTPRSELAVVDEEEEEDDESSDEEIFDMDVEDSKEKQITSAQDSSGVTTEVSHIMNHKDGNTLDVLMAIMLQYVHDVCHGIKKPRRSTKLTKDSAVRLLTEQLIDGQSVCQEGKVRLSIDDKRSIGCACGGIEHDIEALKLLFTELKEVFSQIILCTQFSSHVQFLIFYLIALRPGLATIFLEFLRIKKFEDPNCSRDVRRNAMAYIGSLLARGKFIPFSHVHSCLEIICMWCNSYLDNQERVRATNYEDLQLHSPFYSACQTVFYVFSFRYREYTENSKKLDLARSLNLERLVLSQLNPLQVCAPPIVNNFAAIARRFQLAYCYTIMENNKRLGIPSGPMDESKCIVQTTLDMFFPFDPYLLQRSKVYIANHYREFDGLPEDIAQKEDIIEETDEAMDIIISPKSFDFTYGSSPGFRKLQDEPLSIQ
ncbi:RNA polymerase I-specific transcription initiation factor RRN3 isoform X2 [Panulirus ornatus]